MSNIPMLDLGLEYRYMQKEVDDAIARCLEHQTWIMGPEVKELEGRIAEYLGTKHCIGVASGTDGLVLPLRALAIKTKGEEYFTREDKIITTAFTFTATGDAILRSGATPVFVDIDPDTFNLDIEKLEDCLQEQKGSVVGMIPVHLFGQSCDMSRIMDLAAEHSVFVLEDVAQAFGAEWQGQKAGTIGTCGSYSFFPSKNLGGMGDGGMISTNDDELAELCRMLLKHGGRDKYNVDYIGYNSRLDTLQAAILLVRMNYIDEFNTNRRAIAQFYDEKFATLAQIRTPKTLENAHHVYHQYTLQVTDGLRDELQESLKGAGISSAVYYPVPLHKMKVFQNRCEVFEDLENSEKTCQTVLSLPMEPLFQKEQLERIVEQIITKFEIVNV